MKTFKDYFKEKKDVWKSYNEKLDKHVSDEIKKRKLAKHTVNATDDYKMKKGKPTFKFPSPSGSMIIHVWLRKMTPPAPKGMMAFNYKLEDK